MGRVAGYSQFENNYFKEMCSGSEEGSYSRLIDCVYHSTLGLRVIKKKKREGCGMTLPWNMGWLVRSSPKMHPIAHMSSKLGAYKTVKARL